MSRSSKLTILILSFALLQLQTTISATPLSFACSSASGNFSAYDFLYQTNLNKLLTSLYVKTPTSGFSLHTSGRVNGISLCRGDVTSVDCQSCVAEATNDIRVLCPTSKAAIVWYDNCLLKYSDKDFFGGVDSGNLFQLVNVNDVKGVDPTYFNRTTKELLTWLAAEAASTNSRMFFSGGEVDVYGNTSDKTKTTIYGMAQCTRDLSSEHCRACLDDAVAQLPSCCGGKQGGRVVGGSCAVQYEIYPFLKS